MRLTGIALALLLGAGCHQALGERCQLDTDCADGLYCQIPSGGSRAEGGTCNSIAGSTGDAAVTGDAGTAADASGASDASAPDATTPPDATKSPDGASAADQSTPGDGASGDALDGASGG